MEFKKLFHPIKIGKVLIKNRIAMAPMEIYSLCNPDGTITQRVIDYYVERARGGVGLIITGLTRVENEIEKFRPMPQHNVSLTPIRFVQASTELTEAVHAYDSKIFIQLTAGYGRVCKSSMLSSKPVAPSAIPNYWDPNLTCRELTTEEVEKLVKAFGKAAEISWTAGYDGIEIHAAHEGYLIDQFAVSKWNRRTDKYGGDLEGRLTFPIEILHQIKDTLGNEFPVQIRFSIKSYVKNWQKGGLPGEIFKEDARNDDEGIEVAKILEKEGYDAFNADAGSYEGYYWAHPPIYMGHGCYLNLSEKLKKMVKTPIIVAGRMGIPELARDALQKGKADIIALGRALLADPHWPSKVLEGRIEDIRPCIGCHEGCSREPLRCAVNPATGKERLYELKPANKVKKVLIAGGGIAGMESARVAALREHSVFLYEKSDSLGGHLIEAGAPEFKKDISRLLQWYKVQLKKTGVSVVLNTEVNPELIESKKPNAIIIATGSKQIVPKILGIENSIVATYTDLFLGKKKAGNTVVILGGGLIGCEMALWLSTQGKKVIIIEKLSDVMMEDPFVPYANRTMLLDLLSLNKIKILTNTTIYKIEDKNVIIIDKDFKRNKIECDTVILSIGLQSENQLYNSIKEKTTQTYRIGDCKKPRRILEAIYEGYCVASSI